jgi:hypothetical protein
MAKTWDDLRAILFSKTDPPPDWPFGVRPISQDGLGLFGIVPASNKLFWAGREVVLRNRIRLSCGRASSLLLLPSVRLGPSSRGVTGRMVAGDPRRLSPTDIGFLDNPISTLPSAATRFLS